PKERFRNGAPAFYSDYFGNRSSWEAKRERCTFCFRANKETCRRRDRAYRCVQASYETGRRRRADEGPNVLSDHPALRWAHHSDSRIQSWLSRPAEARPRHESGGIHPQSCWDLWCLGGSRLRGARGCGGTATPWRAGTCDNFLGREFWKRAKAFRRAGKFARSKLCATRRQIPE